MGFGDLAGALRAGAIISPDDSTGIEFTGDGKLRLVRNPYGASPEHVILGDPAWSFGNGGGWCVRGLVGANPGNVAGTTIDLKADFVAAFRPSNKETILVINTGTLTNDITVAGENGRDQAAAFPASDWIHFYFVITELGQIRTRSSLSAPPTGPTLVLGEIAWAYACTLRIQAGLLRNVLIRGNYVANTPRLGILFSGSATVETAISLAIVVPPIAPRYTAGVELFSTTVAATAGNTSVIIRTITGQASLVNQYKVEVGAHARVNMIADLPHLNQNVFYLIDQNQGDNPRLDFLVPGYYVPNGDS